MGRVQVGLKRVLDLHELELARTFVYGKWCEFALERGAARPPDLSGSCKYGSLFMRRIYGGIIAGNYQHQYNLIDGRIVDLSQDSADVLALRRPYLHEPELFTTDEHVASMAGCGPRVESWAAEFIHRGRPAPDAPIALATYG